MTRPRFTSSAICAVPDPRVNPPDPSRVTLVSVHTDHRGDVWWFYEDLGVWRKLPNPVGLPVSKPRSKPADTALKPKRRPRR